MAGLIALIKNFKVEGNRKFGGLLINGTYTDRILIGKILDDS